MKGQLSHIFLGILGSIMFTLLTIAAMAHVKTFSVSIYEQSINYILSLNLYKLLSYSGCLAHKDIYKTFSAVGNESGVIPFEVTKEGVIDSAKIGNLEEVLKRCIYVPIVKEYKVEEEGGQQKIVEKGDYLLANITVEVYDFDEYTYHKASVSFPKKAVAGITYCLKPIPIRIKTDELEDHLGIIRICGVS